MENVKENLLNITSKKLNELYNGDIPTGIKNRYKFEIDTIIKNNFEDIYMLNYLICKKAKYDKEITILRGSGSSSLVAYLLGISNVDPIKYELEFEMFAGIEGEREPDFVVEFSSDYQKTVHKFVTELDVNNKVQEQNLLNMYYIDILEKLQEKTGINYKDVNIDDPKIYNLFSEDEEGNINTDGIPEFNSKEVKELIRKVKPQNIQELIKISGLSHSTMTNKVKLITEHSINEVICTRDDIFSYLQEKGIERKVAFEITEFVRKGRAGSKKYIEQWKEYVSKMILNNVPNWYIESMEEINYLFPKAHSTNYTILALIIAWYKVYYPKEFNEALQKFEGE